MVSRPAWGTGGPRLSALSTLFVLWIGCDTDRPPGFYNDNFCLTYQDNDQCGARIDEFFGDQSVETGLIAYALATHPNYASGESPLQSACEGAECLIVPWRVLLHVPSFQYDSLDDLEANLVPDVLDESNWETVTAEMEYKRELEPGIYIVCAESLTQEASERAFCRGVSLETGDRRWFVFVDSNPNTTLMLDPERAPTPTPVWLIDRTSGELEAPCTPTCL